MENLQNVNSKDVTTKWSQVPDFIYSSAVTMLGKKECSNGNWYEAHWIVMQPATVATVESLLQHT